MLTPHQLLLKDEKYVKDIAHKMYGLEVAAGGKVLELCRLLFIIAMSQSSSVLSQLFFLFLSF